MELIKVIGLCVLCLPAVLLVKKAAAEQALLLTMAILLVAVVGVVSIAAPVLEEVRILFIRAGIEQTYISILIKTVASTLVTRLAADICKDGGAAALTSVIELAGAATSIVIALPLLKAVTELLMGYFT